jgi:hypothetical protein
MNKRFLALACGLVVTGGLAWSLVHWYVERGVYSPPPVEFKPRVMTQTVLAVPRISPSQQVHLAIGGLGFPSESENGQMADLVTTELSRAPGLQLVDRQALDKVLRELGMNLSGLVRAKDAVRAAKLLRADCFLLGTTARFTEAKAVLVARIVDARTGILREVGVLSPQENPVAVAAQLAGFVRQWREAASVPRSRVFLAVGAFADLGVNERQAGFPAQLRAYVTAAFQNKGVALLEREQVTALLQEVRLDLAGLTDQVAQSPPPPMQSAFWLVDGYFQSFETSDFQVEVALNIKRIFGQQKTVVVRDKAGEPIFAKVKETIDGALRSAGALSAPTRTSEAIAQLEFGMELAELYGPSSLVTPGQQIIDERETARRAHNLEEAIRAFQAVLLIEPTNREAKVCLGAALRSQPLLREEEAREYYRELLEEPVQDKWVGFAAQALRSSLRQATIEERARWFKSLAFQNTNAPIAAFQEDAARALTDAEIERGTGPGIQAMAEKRLFQKIKAFDSQQFYHWAMGMDEFALTFGADKAAAARRLTELQKKMTEQAPESGPYILATLVAFQVETNVPVISELEQALDAWADLPQKVPKRICDFPTHLNQVFSWSLQHKCFGLSAKILEAKLRAATKDPRLKPVNDGEDKMALAFVDKAVNRWAEALNIFESYSNRPVYLGNGGPWGPAFTVVLTSKETAVCREKLGLPPVRDPREFDFGKPLLCFCPSGYTSDSQLLLSKFGAFATQADALWIGIAGQLSKLDFGLKTNLSVPLPIDATVPIMAIQPTSSNVWIATGGAGLLRFDQASGKCSRLTAKDGLMMDFISCLRINGENLWIGYGQESSGGVGCLDLRTRRAVSLTSSLGGTQGNQAPRRPVVALAAAKGSEMWLVTQNILFRYDIEKGTWESAPGCLCCTTVANSATDLFVGLGQVGSHDKKRVIGLGVRAFNFQAQQWRDFPLVPAFPNEMVDALTPDGRNLWVGGQGYVALVDPAQGKVIRFAYVRARSVDQIETAGGFVWAQFGHHLYRAPVL